MNELKLKLKKAYPVISGHLVKEIIASTEYINKDVQAMIDNSVASVKDEYTVQEIDEYAEYIETYTHKFLDKLDKLKIDWLITQRPTGLNFSCSDIEMKTLIISEPFFVKHECIAYWTKQLISHRHDTFLISAVLRPNKVGRLIRGVFVRKSILSEILC